MFCLQALSHFCSQVGELLIPFVSPNWCFLFPRVGTQMPKICGQKIESWRQNIPKVAYNKSQELGTQLCQKGDNNSPNLGTIITMLGNNLISVTFVEVQLGSGGILCVAQGAAQSHGKEGEDQRVPAHQLHLRFCALVCSHMCKIGPSTKTGQTTGSL